MKPTIRLLTIVLLYGCAATAALGQYQLYDGTTLVATITVANTPTSPPATSPVTWTFTVTNNLAAGNISRFQFYLRDGVVADLNNFSPDTDDPATGWDAVPTTGPPDYLAWSTTHVASMIVPAGSQAFSVETDRRGGALVRAEAQSGATVGRGVVLSPADPPVYQAYPYPGDADPAYMQGLDQGYDGEDGDSITSVPGILAFDPGTDDLGVINWINFTDPCADPDTYDWEGTELEKVRPEMGEEGGDGVCDWPERTITQTDPPEPPTNPGIRYWWPLMYEPVGTTWTIDVDWSDGVSSYTSTWTYTVDVTIESLRDLVELYHELPFGTDQVPLISDEVLYWGTPAEEFTDLNHDGDHDPIEPFLDRNLNGVYDEEVVGIYDMLDNAADALAAFDYEEAIGWLEDFEEMIGDRCIGESPAFPTPTGPDTGIAETADNPACCILVDDAEFLLVEILGLL